MGIVFICCFTFTYIRDCRGDHWSPARSRKQNKPTAHGGFAIRPYGVFALCFARLALRESSAREGGERGVSAFTLSVTRQASCHLPHRWRQNLILPYGGKYEHNHNDYYFRCVLGSVFVYYFRFTYIRDCRGDLWSPAKGYYAHKTDSRADCHYGIIGRAGACSRRIVLLYCGRGNRENFHYGFKKRSKMIFLRSNLLYKMWFIW